VLILGVFRASISLLISSFIFWIVCFISFICLYFLWAHLTVYSYSLWGQIVTFVFLLWGHLLFSGIHYLIALSQHRYSFYIAYIVFLYSFRIPSQSNKTRARNKRDSKREERSQTIPICRWCDLYLRDPPKKSNTKTTWKHKGLEKSIWIQN
jgi:1,4-dihydroxy-2-naphthoate octaprenyltransferase